MPNSLRIPVIENVVNWLAFDCDGVLWPPSRPDLWDEREMKVLDVLKKHHIKVAFISGKGIDILQRAVSTAREKIKHFNIDFLCGEGGLVIYNPRTLEFHISEEYQEVSSQIEDIVKWKTNNQQADDKIPCDVGNISVDGEQVVMWREQGKKVLITLVAPKRRMDIARKVAKYYQGQIEHKKVLAQVILHGDAAIDILHKDAGKDNMILHLAEDFGLLTKQIVTFGDGVNDIPMFRGTFSITSKDCPREVRLSAITTQGGGLSVNVPFPQAIGVAIVRLARSGAFDCPDNEAIANEVEQLYMQYLGDLFKKK